MHWAALVFVTLSVSMSGGFQPLTYDWYLDGVKVLEPVGTNSPELFLPGVTEDDAGVYEVYITDANTDMVQSSTELVLI